jgi:hypothetical protein
VDGLAAWAWRLDAEDERRWNGLFTVVALPDSSEQTYKLRFETWGPEALE